MLESRTIGMMINHHEIEHTLTQMADVIRNAAYKVATERRDRMIKGYAEMFDETGTLIAYDEMSIKALLKDALEHYLQFSAGTQNAKPIDLNYYLGDSFQLVQEYINENAHTLSFLSASFAQACGALAGMLAPVIEDLSRSGQQVEKVESYTINTNESYYVVTGESFDNQETYDPAEDDLSTVDTYQTPEELAKVEARRRQKEELADAVRYTDYVNAVASLPVEDHVFQHMSKLRAGIKALYHTTSIAEAEEVARRYPNDIPRFTTDTVEGLELP